MEWINVKDKLPTKEGEYLVCERDTVTVNYFEKDKWMVHAYDPNKYITHWMPLPDPPKNID